jgi:squalene-associated FAD-dependent desaturase
MKKSVAIIGGGVAGIAAAVALSEADCHVELFEKRPLLGGRASSFVDKETGERLDECQHGTMRCCTNLEDLLRRLGVADQIDYHDAIHFLDSDGKQSTIANCPLPAPMHTAISFLKFQSLNLKDKIGIGRAMMAMLRAHPDPQNDTLSMAEWFARMRQTEQSVKRFWRPVLVSACNEELERISCTHGFKIFRDGFLMHPTTFHFGIPRVPLGTLYTEPTLALLKQHGGCVNLKTIVEEIHFANNRITALTLNDGETVTADYYVSGLQCDLLLKLLPPEITDGVPYWQNIAQIELSPICGVHLWFDRAFDCPPALAILDRTTEWIFNKTATWNLPPERGTYLSIVVSASRRLASLSKEEIVSEILAEVRACVPASQSADLTRSQVIRWPKATISPKPGIEALRPMQTSPIENLFIAGEWTQTGWPSTMEGAARSGYLAAEALLAHAGTPRRFLVPDLPPAPLVRLLSGRQKS